jgi:methionyl-tRNA formyltransferase
MRVAAIGRTSWLLNAVKRIAERGHEIPVVWTCEGSAHYDVKESDFEELAQSQNAVFVDEIAINSPENIKRLAGFGCDIAVSVNWATVLTPAVMEIFKYGILNAHAGDLPRYRGNACVNWAIRNGESEVGLCIHEMVEALDAGRVVVRDRLSIDDSTYVNDIYDWMLRRVPDMFVEAIEGLDKGTLNTEPQADDPGTALRCFPLRPEDSRIDWSLTATEILRVIRSSSDPFPGAHCLLELDRNVTIWRARRYEYPSPFNAIPGQVCLNDADGPVIACGEGMVLLEKVSVDGAESGKKAIGKSLRNRLT